jgi:hypothetical protein
MLSAILYTIRAILKAANIVSLTGLPAAKRFPGLGRGARMVVGLIYTSDIAPIEMCGMMTTSYNIFESARRQ